MKTPPAIAKPATLPTEHRLALSAAEVARALGVSTRFVIKLALEGRIPSVTVGRRRLFSPSAVKAALFGEHQ